MAANTQVNLVPTGSLRGATSASLNNAQADTLNFDLLEMAKQLSENLVGLQDAAKEKNVATDSKKVVLPNILPEEENSATSSLLKSTTEFVNAFIQNELDQKKEAKLEAKILKETLALAKKMAGTKINKDVKEFLEGTTPLMLAKAKEVAKPFAATGSGSAAAGSGSSNNMNPLNQIGGGLGGLTVVALMELIIQGVKQYQQENELATEQSNLQLVYGKAQADKLADQDMANASEAESDRNGATVAMSVMTGAMAVDVVQSYRLSKPENVIKAQIKDCDTITTRLENRGSSHLNMEKTPDVLEAETTVTAKQAAATQAEETVKTAEATLATKQAALTKAGEEQDAAKVEFDEKTRVAQASADAGIVNPDASVERHAAETRYNNAQATFNEVSDEFADATVALDAATDASAAANLELQKANDTLATVKASVPKTKAIPESIKKQVFANELDDKGNYKLKIGNKFDHPDGPTEPQIAMEDVLDSLEDTDGVKERTNAVSNQKRLKEQLEKKLKEATADKEKWVRMAGMGFQMAQQAGTTWSASNKITQENRKAADQIYALYQTEAGVLQQASSGWLKMADQALAMKDAGIQMFAKTGDTAAQSMIRG